MAESPAAPLDRPVRDLPLEFRLKRLMLYRVVTVTTLLAVAIYVESTWAPLPRTPTLYGLIAATYALTLLHAAALRFLRPIGPQVYAQVIGDLAIITGLIYTMGGIGRGAGFLLLYPVSVLSGSVLLPRGRGLLLAGLAIAFFGSLLHAVRAGLVPSEGLGEILDLPAQYLYYLTFVVGVTCGLAGMIGGYFSEALLQAGRQLEHAVEEAAELRERNTLIVDSIQSGLLTASAAGTVVHVNDCGRAILGTGTAQIKGRALHEVFGPEGFDPVMLAARLAHRELARFETDFRRPDGELRHLGVSVCRLKSARSEADGVLLAFQDLTDVKRLEAEVRIKEKLAAVGEMAAHLAHEIRNPLGSISGSAQVLLADANVSPDQERLLTIIKSESRRLSDSLNQFLMQVRVPPRPLRPVDIGPVLAGAVELLRNAPEIGAGQRVESLLAPGPHVCLADPDRILQVFWNLARNGLEAMGGGGVLHVTLDGGEHDVRLVVRDEGTGMTAVAEPTPQGFAALSSRGRLGLAIVYQIVREHHGDLRFHSVAERGTAVEVVLPRVRIEAEAEA
jgi:two-component system sensor histidine kinase PilS (NtrC family)